MPVKRTTKPKRAVNSQPELPRAVAKVLAGGKVSTDSGALLNSLIEAWGSTDRLARDIFHEFQKAPPGGATRQRILEMCQRLILATTTQGLANAKSPSDMGDDELASIAMNYLRRMTGDVTSTPGPNPGTQEEG
jgi:hypothetical protein